MCVLRAIHSKENNTSVRFVNGHYDTAIDVIDKSPNNDGIHFDLLSSLLNSPWFPGYGHPYSNVDPLFARVRVDVRVGGGCGVVCACVMLLQIQSSPFSSKNQSVMLFLVAVRTRKSPQHQPSSQQVSLSHHARPLS